MRYFFISYNHNLGFGNMTIQDETFPSEITVIKTLQKYDPLITQVTILSLFEFKTKEDFGAFNNTGE